MKETQAIKAKILVKDFYAHQSKIVTVKKRLANAKECAIYCVNEMGSMVKPGSEDYKYLVGVADEIRKITSIGQLENPAI